MIHPTHRFGAWAAGAAAAFAIAYGVAQILQVLGALADLWDRILIFAPSLLLAPAYVMAAAAVHVVTPPDSKVWTLSALALAVLYAASCAPVYAIQLGSVIPHDVNGAHADTVGFACCAFRAPLTGVDLMGYAYMSLSTWLMAQAFHGDGAERRLRVALMANGVLALPIVAQLAWPQFIWLAAPWLVTFPAAMILLAGVFARGVQAHHHHLHHVRQAVP